jgi:hypothetical protein
MLRLLGEENITATYTELPGKEHWWWDTRYCRLPVNITWIRDR